MPNDDIIWKEASYFDENKNFFLVKRRLYCSAYTLNFNKIQDDHLISLFSDVKREYLIKNRFNDYCKVDQINKIGTILYVYEIITKKKRIVKSPEKIMKKVRKLLF